jgi:uncharacterized protein (DUF1800 family)
MRRVIPMQFLRSITLRWKSSFRNDRPGGHRRAAGPKAALDTLANHPNVGPLLRRLIQHMVTSNPSPARWPGGGGVQQQRQRRARRSEGDCARGAVRCRAVTPASGPNGGKLREPTLRVDRAGLPD